MTLGIPQKMNQHKPIPLGAALAIAAFILFAFGFAVGVTTEHGLKKVMEELTK